MSDAFFRNVHVIMQEAHKSIKLNMTVSTESTTVHSDECDWKNASSPAKPPRRSTLATGTIIVLHIALVI